MGNIAESGWAITTHVGPVQPSFTPAGILCPPEWENTRVGRETPPVFHRKREIQRLRETVNGTDSFLDKAKRYTDITELPPELLWPFIERIVVHKKELNTCPRPWRFTTTALAMSAVVSRMWKKHWKHQNPRTQRNPGRHRKHDDLPGYPGDHLLPL